MIGMSWFQEESSISMGLEVDLDKDRSVTPIYDSLLLH